MNGVRHRLPVSAPEHRALGLAGLFSGAALVAAIVLSLPLFALLCVTSGLAACWGWQCYRRALPSDRRHVLSVLRASAISGAVATATYDLGRFLLAELDASTYQPFEAVRAFGAMLVGEEAPAIAITVVGSLFHVVNGTSFGVAYGFLLAPRDASALTTLLRGIGWALFLETFQITLYPGWLDIRAYSEFVQIGFVAHFIYGATLSLSCRHLLGHRLRNRLLLMEARK